MVGADRNSDTVCPLSGSRAIRRAAPLPPCHYPVGYLKTEKRYRDVPLPTALCAVAIYPLATTCKRESLNQNVKRSPRRTERGGWTAVGERKVGPVRTSSSTSLFVFEKVVRLDQQRSPARAPVVNCFSTRASSVNV